MIEEPLAYGDSIIHQLNPATKIISTVILSFAAALSNDFRILVIYFIISLVLVLMAKLKFKDVMKRLERDLKRGTFKVLTPYTLAQAYNIRISTAKKALREAARRGLLVLYSGGRTPIYVKPE